MISVLIVGIGNPGSEYHDTRHNVGVMALEYLAKKLDVGALKPDTKLFAALATKSVPIASSGKKPAKAIFALPQTYVNESGKAVSKIKNFYKLKPEHIIIIQDDLDIPFGMTKMSFDKNSGGHRGIESIISALRTKKFYRLRIGTANPTVKKAHAQSENGRDEMIKTFVLAKFTPSEKEKLKAVFKEIYEKLLLIV